MAPVVMNLLVDGLPSSLGGPLSDKIRVSQMTGEERLARPYRFDIDVVSGDPDLPLEELLLRPAQLHLSVGAKRRIIHGIIHEAQETNEAAGGSYAYRFTLAPRLSLLAHSSHFRSFGTTGPMTVVDVVETLLRGEGRGGLLPGDWAFRLAMPELYPKRDFWLQAAESDLDYLHRVIEHWGIFYFFEQDAGHETIVFADASGFCPKSALGESLTFDRKPGQSHREDMAVVSLKRRLRAVPGEVALRAYNPETPHLDLTASAKVQATLVGGSEAPPGAIGRRQEVDTYFANKEEGELFALARAEELASERDVFEMETMSPLIAPGCTFTLKGHFRNTLNQSYLPISVSHHGRQALANTYAEGDLKGPAYESKLRAIPASAPYRAPRETPRPVMTGAMPARVEANKSENGRAVLDAQGHYRVAMLLNDTALPPGQGSPPLRLSQPYGGPSGMGMHFPLVDRTEVMLGWTGGDPDRPFILGSLPNAAGTGPVTAKNKAENTIATLSGISMIMSDGSGAVRPGQASVAEAGAIPQGASPEADKTQIYTAFTVPAYGSKLPHHFRIGDVATNPGVEQKIIKAPEFGAQTIEFRGEHLTSKDYGGIFSFTPGNRTETTVGNQTTLVGGHRREVVQGSSTSIVLGDRPSDYAEVSFVGNSFIAQMSHKPTLSYSGSYTLSASVGYTLSTSFGPTTAINLGAVNLAYQSGPQFTLVGELNADVLGLKPLTAVTDLFAATASGNVVLSTKGDIQTSVSSLGGGDDKYFTDDVVFGHRSAGKLYKMLTSIQANKSLALMGAAAVTMQLMQLQLLSTNKKYETPEEQEKLLKERKGQSNDKKDDEQGLSDHQLTQELVDHHMKLQNLLATSSANLATGLAGLTMARTAIGYDIFQKALVHAQAYEPTFTIGEKKIHASAGKEGKVVLSAGGGFKPEETLTTPSFVEIREEGIRIAASGDNAGHNFQDTGPGVTIQSKKYSILVDNEGVYIFTGAREIFRLTDTACKISAGNITLNGDVTIIGALTGQQGATFKAEIKAPLVNGRS